MNLRPPFSTAVDVAEAIAISVEPQVLPVGLTSGRWRGYLEHAQSFADLRAGGHFVEAYRSVALPVLGLWLLSYLGDEPPQALVGDIDTRMTEMSVEDYETFAAREAGVEAFRASLEVVRQLLARWKGKVN